MKRVQPHFLGVAIGLPLGIWHAGWSLLVWMGWAQWILNFIFQLHMITPPYTIAGFSFLTAIQLVAVSAGVGYSLGLFFAVVWNLFVADDMSPRREKTASGPAIGHGAA